MARGALGSTAQFGDPVCDLVFYAAGHRAASLLEFFPAHSKDQRIGCAGSSRNRACAGRWILDLLRLAADRNSCLGTRSDWAPAGLPLAQELHAACREVSL